MNQEVLRIENLKKTFVVGGEYIDVLKDINISVNRKEMVGIFGKSGSGKSTLMNMITGIDKPTQGGVWVNKEPIHHYSEAAMAKMRGQRFGIVFQFFQLLPVLTVLENIVLPMDFCKKYDKGERYGRATGLLKKLGIQEQAYKYPSALSGGQQQRVAIARALANDPDIIIADEPTGNLDSKTSAEIFDIFSQQANEGKTVLFVTHDLSLKNRFTRNIIISDGKIAKESEVSGK